MPHPTLITAAAAGDSALWTGITAILVSIVTGGFSLWGVLAAVRQENRNSKRRERVQHLRSMEGDRDEYRRLWRVECEKSERLERRFDLAQDTIRELEERLRRRDADHD